MRTNGFQPSLYLKFGRFQTHIRVENLRIVTDCLSSDIAKLPLKVLRLSGNLHSNETRLVELLNRLGDRLADLMLEGNWVNDDFIASLKGMARLEAVRIVPHASIVPTRNNSNRVATSVVLDFAHKCPVLREPRFLRNVNVMRQLFDGQSPYHPDWRIYCQMGSRPSAPSIL